MFGRHPSLKIILDHVSVSRRHMQIDFEPDRGWIITDLKVQTTEYIVATVPILQAVYRFGP